MITFSTRVEKDRFGLHRYRSLSYKLREGDRDTKFLEPRVRNRLQHLIKVSIKSKGLLLPFLRVRDEEARTKFIHEPSLRDLSTAEIGNDVTDLINCKTLELNEEAINDFHFFDLIELFIVFSKTEVGQKFKDNLMEIFEEESLPFTIEGYMIVEKGPSTIWALMPLIDDIKIKEKLVEYRGYTRLSSSNYRAMAKCAADILNRLTSSETSQGDTKKHATTLTKDLAAHWTSKTKVPELADIFSESIKNQKNINNRIEDVRHSEKHTINVTKPDIYKNIAETNLSLIELIITSLPSKYIKNDNPEDIVRSYAEKYGVDIAGGWIVRAPEKPVDLSDIPF